jgi:hypothetical protein
MASACFKNTRWPGKPLSKLHAALGKLAPVTAPGVKIAAWVGATPAEIGEAPAHRPLGCSELEDRPSRNALLSHLVICTIERHRVLRVPADHGRSEVLYLGEPGATGSGEQDQRPKQAGRPFLPGKVRTAKMAWKGRPWRRRAAGAAFPVPEAILEATPALMARGGVNTKPPPETEGAGSQATGFVAEVCSW